jgi:hypothetical protein
MIERRALRPKAPAACQGRELTPTYAAAPGEQAGTCGAQAASQNFSGARLAGRLSAGVGAGVGAGAGRRLAAAALTLTLALPLLGGGCYQGEWRAGPEVPVATTSRLLPTRSIETWELLQTQTPYVIQIKGTSTPRCRYALYGKARRIDTGKFERVGGGFWKTIAISLGALGGAAAGFGGAGYVSNLQPALGRPIMYGLGGGLVVGGLAACFTALARPAKLRYAFCGIFTGLGAAVLGGALVSSLTAPGSVTTSNPAGTPLLDPSLLQTAMFAGGGAIGGSIATGIVGNLWSGYEDRVRSVDVNNAALWDAQQSESTCGQVTALYGRAVGLDIIAENVQSGPGSEAMPLKMRVALSGQSTQPVDLRALRQALPSCGALRVQLNPEVVYEEFTDDYTPPVTPEQLNLAARPVFGQVLPREGLTLPAPETRQRLVAKTAIVPGISPETMANVERQCRGEAPLPPAGKRPAAGTRPAAPRPAAPRPAPPPEQEPAEQTPADAAPPPAEAPPPPPPPGALPPEELFFSTPGLLQPHSVAGQSEEGECSLNSTRARFSDCEAQCAKALSLGPCMLEFRKCYLESRGSTQVQRDRDQCNLSWEQCLFRVGVSPGSWRRCVEGCAQANEPYNCQRKPERLSP